MGGGAADHGGNGDFRAKVWSMTGGPYCRPKHWKRNTAVAMFGIFLVCIPIAIKSAELEEDGSEEEMQEIHSIQSGKRAAPPPFAPAVEKGSTIYSPMG
ncbi:hypothetical protein TanjilG_25227 [Lupinus angustifolius]|uniref:Uncharacterized protein n=1 Tax=Lupinus angustifolius TaxID=3871 RepID=A0A1J7GKS6_LUPAN|nr:hypothetical protein TanjilG_25227 [Lupinus angustifolius]